MIDYEDLKIVELRMNDDETELTIFLDGDGSIGINQFPGLIRLMKSGNFTHLRGSSKSGWTISKSSEPLDQKNGK